MRFLIGENAVGQSHGRTQRDAVDVLKRFFAEIGDDVEEFTVDVDRADDAESEAGDDGVGGSEDVQRIRFEVGRTSGSEVSEGNEPSVQNFNLF